MIQRGQAEPGQVGDSTMLSALRPSESSAQLCSFLLPYPLYQHTALHPPTHSPTHQ